MKEYRRPKLIQLLKTVALLLEKSPLSGAEIMEGIGAVPVGTRILDAAQKRSFERIKEELLELGVRLEKHHGLETGGKGASFSTTLYSIPQRRYMMRDLHLTDPERGALHLLAKVLGTDEGFPLRRNLGQALQKLSAHSPQPHEESIPPISGPPLAAAPEHDVDLLDRLMIATASRLPVEFEYHSFHSGDLRTRRIEPYGYFSRERIWYVVGRDVDLDDIRVFRIGRITADKGIKVFDRDPFEIPRNFKLRDYSTLPPWNFRSDAPPREATVAFDPEDFWRVREFCERQGDVSESENGEIRWRASVRDFEPLVRWMLPFGTSARPIAPDEFVEAYKHSVTETLKNYLAEVRV